MENENNNKRKFNVLVLDGDPTHDWCQLFRGITLEDGSEIHVYQASWMETSVVTFGKTCLVTVAPIRESGNNIVRPSTIGINPDFAIIRNQVRGPTPVSDKRNILYGLMIGGVPAVNSLHSVLCNLERPVMMAALREIEKRLGKEEFPVIDFNYYPNNKEMIITPSLPSIIKVSHAHAGMGKIKANDSEVFRDVSTILALTGDYCTGEEYIETEFGIRVQKIGNSYRVMKKMMTGSGWKSQFGGSNLTCIELTEKYKLWADECSKLFGGLDILAVDALHGTDGKDYIIELNDTAIGILTDHWEDDTKELISLVISRMNNIYVHNIPLPSPSYDFNNIIINENNAKNNINEINLQEKEKEERKRNLIIEKNNIKSTPPAKSSPGISLYLLIFVTLIAVLVDIAIRQKILNIDHLFQ